MFLIFRPPHRPNLVKVNEAMPKGWTKICISESSSSLQQANRCFPRRMQISLCINAELLLGTTSRSAFRNGIRQKNLEGDSYVNDRSKKMLWEKLIAHFTLPVFDDDDDEAKTKAMRDAVDACRMHT